jgi:NO-binding membrane sensor protein with MHYT domain
MFSIMILMACLLVMIILALANKSLRRRLCRPILLAVVGLVVMAMLPWADILAGFLALPGDASLVVRYEPMLTFVGAILAIVAFVSQFFITRQGPVSKLDQPAADLDDKVRDK